MDSEVIVGGIATEHIEALWPVLEQFIEMSIIKGTPVPEETAQDVKEELLKKELSGWAAMQGDEILAFMTTYIADLPLVRRAVIKHLAGVEMKTWLQFYPLVEEWAKDHGATEIVIKGRAGWARVLQAYGYEPQYVALSKQL